MDLAATFSEYAPPLVMNSIAASANHTLLSAAAPDAGANAARIESVHTCPLSPRTQTAQNLENTKVTFDLRY